MPHPPPPQTYATHRRFVPLYHYVIFAILVVNLLWSGVRLVRAPGFETALGLTMALAILGIFFYARTFALTAQDRIIRLEMRLRLERILPADLKGRIPELSTAQLVGLRFASDAELPDLVREVLANDIRDRESIKKRIKSWQADHLRV